MHTFSPELTTHLDGAATTLCHCWKLIRRDGVTLGFTDHDRDIVFSGVTFAAGTGLEAADMSAESGFAIGGGEVSGALQAQSLRETELASGLYDDASVEIWLVNWQDITQRALLDVASIGEIKRTDTAFIAEMRGLAHRLDEERGRVFRLECSADVGDAKCGVNLTSPANRGTGMVSALDGAMHFVASGLSAYASEMFTGGKLTWTSGANAGAAFEIKGHTVEGSNVWITLWVTPAAPIAITDTFTISAGCNKTFAICREKFSNTLNFRGFPHMLGNDFVLRLPQQGETGMDGGSLFK
jgi:uncharacterized phage protein (TIGR02218 family)